MKLAFHIGARGTLFSKLICWKTKSRYSHVELVLQDPDFDNQTSICFSADEKDGGTRFKEIDLSDRTQWELIAIPTNTRNRLAAWKYAEDHLDLRYDWLGILGFVLPWGEHDDNDRFCSEIVCDILQQPDVEGWFPRVKAWEVSPGELYDMVEKQLCPALR